MSISTWYRAARRGQNQIYHRGFLASDRGKYPGLDTDAKTVWGLAETNRVALTQRRLGAHSFEYIVTKLR